MSSKTQVAYTDDGDWVLDAPEEKEYELLSEGLHNVICVEVVPPTLRTDFHGNPSAQTRLVFAAEETTTDGKQKTVSSKWMPVKTHPKSNFGKTLREWLEADFPSDDDIANKRFRMQAALEGRPARVMVEHHKDNEGRTWARILKVKPGTVKFDLDGSYVRTTEREGAVAPVDVNAALAEEEGSPF